MLPQSPESVLDFGAGEGDLVRALRDAGISAHGIEPSQTARATALRSQGVELFARLDNLPSSQFSAVTLLHSLEHVVDPIATLTNLRAALKAGGHMFIEVPHAGSADMWIPKSKRTILDLPLHLHHFTPDTLGTLLRRAGFSIIATQLFNSHPVEAALACRHRRRGATDETANTAPRTAASPDGSAAVDTRPGVPERLLTRLRTFLPGPKFQLLVRPEER